MMEVLTMIAGAFGIGLFVMTAILAGILGAATPCLALLWAGCALYDRLTGKDSSETSRFKDNIQGFIESWV